MRGGAGALRVAELVISEDVDAHIWNRHGIDSSRLPEILAGRYTISRNRKRRSATHELVGYDFGGQCYVVLIRPTSDLQVWQVITAWHCD